MALPDKSSVELRKFAIVMTVAFGIIGGILWWKSGCTLTCGYSHWKLFAGLSGFFLITGLVYPRILLPIEWAWMKLAHYMSIVMTYIILTLTFFLIITPMGLLLKLMGKDLLSQKFPTKEASYWVKVEEDGPSTRYDKPY